MYLIGLVVPLLSFFLQIWPRLINRYFGVDTWRHLMYADYIRKHKKLPESIKDRYIISAPFGYPPILLIFLSFFPKKFTDRYQFLFSPFFDSVHNYIIFAATIYLTHNLVVGLFAQIIAALTPVIIIEASNLNTRTLSYLFFSLSFFPLLLFSVNHNYLWLSIAFVALFILFFTHRFALQTYLFTIIGFTLLEKNFTYPLFFLIVFLAVLLIGGKLYRAILYEHIGLLRYWIKNSADMRFGHQFRGIKKSSQRIDFINRLYLFSMKTPILYIISANPWLGIFFIVFFSNIFNILPVQTIISSVIATKLSMWIIFTVIAGILILSIKPLRFLGEGYRYIEYSVFPVSVMVASYTPYFINQFGQIFLSFFMVLSIATTIAIIFLQRKTILQDRNRTIGKEKWEIINYLNRTEGKKTRLAIFPLQLGDAMMYFLKGKVLTSDSVLGLEKISDIFPTVKSPMSEIIHKYNLNYIFFDKLYVELKEIGLKKYTIIKDLGNYILIKVWE